MTTLRRYLRLFRVQLGMSANGTTFGNIWLRAKSNVTVEGVSTRFAGEWYVTSVTHNIKKGEYKQNFSLAREGLISLTPRVLP